MKYMNRAVDKRRLGIRWSAVNALTHSRRLGRVRVRDFKMADKLTYYEILGVTRDSTLKEVNNIINVKKVREINVREVNYGVHCCKFCPPLSVPF